MNYEALMKKQLLHMPAYRLPPQISDMMKQYGVDHIEKWRQMKTCLVSPIM